ncbi:MAG: sortase, partial [Anaerolineales bacterium]|nr:sortase [Anaerolineales bacterium]
LSGQTTGTVTINPTTDATVEADETVIITIDAGTGYTVGTPSSATGTITNDETPAATIAVSPTSVLEDGATNLVYTVTLDKAPASDITINLTTTGTATTLTDYTGAAASVTILSGQTTGTVTINPTTDATVEADETVIITIDAGTGYTVGTPSSATGTILGGVFDPPMGIKTYNDDGLPEMEFRMVWINSSNTASVNTQVIDNIPDGTTYVSGSLTCVTRGSSATASAATSPLNTIISNSSCAFDGSNNRIQWQGSIGPDSGNLTEQTAANEVVITFRVRVQDAVDQIFNSGSARVDSDNDNDFLDEVPASQSTSNQVSWTRSLSQVDELPSTGFAPGSISELPNQPENKLYSATDMWIEIPRLGVKLPIVGVPMVDKAWDVSWLSQQAGWLNGTAFPGWVGNSVLTSHVTLPNGTPGPFTSLGKLKWGDKVILHSYGSVYTFEVRENRIVAPNDRSVLKHEEESWITLLTCKTYNEKTGVYSGRISVRAVLLKVELEKSPASSNSRH